MRIFVITKKTLIIAACVLFLIILALLIWLCFLDGSATAVSSTLSGEYERTVLAGRKKELPVYSVERSDKSIALTIDAAWEDDKTDFILKTLREHDVKATFFLCGFWAEKYPDKVRAIVADGHVIGNHSATHPHMAGMNAAAIKKELEDFDALLSSITGTRSTLFRAPYGEYDDNVILTSRAAGYEVVQWDVDTVDWREERSAQTILDDVLPALSPGCIILCHNNGYKIEEYLSPLIETAHAEGYSFVTVDKLLLEGETIIDVNGVQKKA